MYYKSEKDLRKAEFDQKVDKAAEEDLLISLHLKCLLRWLWFRIRQSSLNEIRKRTKGQAKMKIIFPLLGILRIVW